jgi:hypothetical protein
MLSGSDQACTVLSGPNPAIAGEAIRKALGTDQTASATGRTVTERQAALDTAELRDLERDEYYGEPAGRIEPHPAPGARRRSFLDRLLRR